jgi:hypothetical protein
MRRYSTHGYRIRMHFLKQFNGLQEKRKVDDKSERHNFLQDEGYTTRLMYA